MIRRPSVTMLDEPLSHLDAALRLETRIEIKRIHQRVKGTFIYVTHDQVEAMTLGQRVAVLKDGILQQVAPPDELYEKPLNSFVAQFIGENNTLSGVVETMGEGVCTVRLDSGELAVVVYAGGEGARATRPA